MRVKFPAYLLPDTGQGNQDCGFSCKAEFSAPKQFGNEH